jgi:hypothetical protein
VAGDLADALAHSMSTRDADELADGLIAWGTTFRDRAEALSFAGIR